MAKTHSKSKQRSTPSADRSGRHGGRSERAGEGVAETASDPLPFERTSTLVRCVVTLLLLFHLAAVFLPPFTFATRSTPGVVSPAALPMLNLVRPYVDMMFLDHGYFFFAPNPGASHLLRYRIEFADDRETVEGVLPDLKQHYPRLLYHRHFMLSEQLHAMYAPPLPPPAEVPGPEQRQAWQARRELYLARRDAIRQHLKARFNADRVSVTRVEHRPPDVFEVVDGKSLSSPDLFRELSDER